MSSRSPAQAEGHQPALLSVALVAAALVMFVAAASIAGLALAGAGGDGTGRQAEALGGLALAAWLAWAGMEMLRRRHFAVAALTPAALALVNLGYVFATGRAEGLGAVVLMLIAFLLVRSARPSFRD